MDLEKRDIITIDVSEYGQYEMGALTLSDNILKEVEGKDFDFIHLKTDLFTKEYDKHHRLQAVIPFFVDVRVEQPAEDLIDMEEYHIKTGAKVNILQDNKGVGYIYSIKIPEMNITFQQIIDLKNKVEEFKETGVTTDEYIKRWFEGYGILEHLLLDEKVLEVNVNPPGYKTAMRIVHADYGECVSNIFPSEEFLDIIATRLKINTGRPLNKAQPQLDGEIEVEGARARVAAIKEPFSIFGTGYSIRKHREDPWTLPLFMKNGMVDPWFAGLMSFVITHGRAFLTAGPRGSGKTSLLGSLLLEILPKYRILTIEDTQELPINSYKKLGYDILPLKVRSALMEEGMEMPFDIGLRTSLRLGDSCLIVGEIRSKEAKVLYESMRVGAMSNVVAGTIHGDSPYGVYDRVVNDLGVPKGSFKVTDLIITSNQVKDPTGLQRYRRVLKVTEVLKDWEETPQFQDLLVYNPEKDKMEPTDAFLNGKSVLLQDILSRTRGYKGYQDMISDINLRSWAKMKHIEYGKDSQLEGGYVAKVNIIFANLMVNYKPLESKQNEKSFKQEFEKQLKEFLEQDRKQKEREEKESQSQQSSQESNKESSNSQSTVSSNSGGSKKRSKSKRKGLKTKLKSIFRK